MEVRVTLPGFHLPGCSPSGLRHLTSSEPQQATYINRDHYLIYGKQGRHLWPDRLLLQCVFQGMAAILWTWDLSFYNKIMLLQHVNKSFFLNNARVVAQDLPPPYHEYPIWDLRFMLCPPNRMERRTHFNCACVTVTWWQWHLLFFASLVSARKQFLKNMSPYKQYCHVHVLFRASLLAVTKVIFKQGLTP